MSKQIEEVLANKLLTAVLGLFIPIMVGIMGWSANQTYESSQQISRLAAEVNQLVTGNFASRVTALETKVDRNENDLREFREKFD